MSHFVEVKSIKVMDLDVVEQAAHGLGLMLVRGQDCYHGWAGMESKACQHALVALKPGATAGYEVGLVPAAGGGWTLGWDSYGQGGEALRGLCGNSSGDMGGLLQAYSLGLIAKTMQQTGMQLLQQVRRPDGVVEVRVMQQA